MELNLEREHINCYELVLDTSMDQEETIEAIVPDACPDIARIVDASGQICLTGKNIHETDISVTGTVRAIVLYQPEDRDELCRVEVKIPFAFRLEQTGLHAQGRCVAAPCLRSVDVRVLNPRKILVRVDIGMSLQCFQPQELILCRGVACDQEAGVQQRTIQHMAYITAAVQEKEFTFYDEIHLTAGPGGTAQLMSVQADAWCTESKIIGNKLIFKGETALRLRYQVEGELCCMRCPVSFSQIMEVSDVGETADCELTMCITGVDCAMAGEDGRTLNITLELLGQAVVRDRYPVTVLQDIYSTAYHMTTQRDICTISQVVEHAVRPQSVRELLETGTAVKNVVDAGATVCQVRHSREEGQMSVSAELKLNVLYLDEQDQLQTLSRTINVSGRLDLPAQCACQCRCRCSDEVFAVPAAGGVELRFNPEFYCLITRQQSISAVTGIRLGELRAADQNERQPSVVLRLASPGEELWDIAKAYSTTQEHILQANQLEGDELPAGQMLLIPKIR